MYMKDHILVLCSHILTDEIDSEVINFLKFIAMYIQITFRVNKILKTK